MKSGYVPALGTPLDAAGNLLKESYRRQIEDQIQAGAVGLLCMGSMGIQAFLRSGICPQVAQTAVEAAQGVPVFVGAMDTSIARVRERMAAMEDIDVAGFVLTPPYYSPASPKQMINFFKGAAGCTEHKILLYDLPGVTQCKITYEMVLQLLREIPSLAGIKSADLQMFRRLKLNPEVPEDFIMVYSGLDTFDIAYRWGITNCLDGMACLFSISFLLGGITLCFDPAPLQLDGGMLIIAAVSGATLVLAQLCMLLAMQSGTMGIVTAFSTAGLIVPCIAGMLFMGERMSVWQWLGITLFIAASYLLGRSAKTQNTGFNKKTVLLLVGALLANGGTMLCQKLFTFLRPAGSVSAFSMLSFAIPACFFGAILLLERAKGKQEPMDRKLYLPILLLAAALFVMNQLVTKATAYVPSAILFTVPNAGNNVIAAAMAAVWVKEKITAYSLAGLALSILSVILVLGLAG